jgi:hypothetical protein
MRGFCCNIVNLGSWGRHLFLIKTISSFFKIFSRTIGTKIQSNLIHIILGGREFKFVQIKGQVLFKGEIITKM